VRRCWRFGQKNAVTVDLVATDGQEHIIRNLRRKASAADKMFTELVSFMNDVLKIGTGRTFDKKLEAPSWLLQNKK
jgi:hypothetical protein